MALIVGCALRRLLAFACCVALRRSNRLHPSVRAAALLAVELL